MFYSYFFQLILLVQPLALNHDFCIFFCFWTPAPPFPPALPPWLQGWWGSWRWGRGVKVVFAAVHNLTRREQTWSTCCFAFGDVVSRPKRIMALKPGSHRVLLDTSSPLLQPAQPCTSLRDWSGEDRRWDVLLDLWVVLVAVCSSLQSNKHRDGIFTTNIFSL